MNKIKLLLLLLIFIILKNTLANNIYNTITAKSFILVDYNSQKILAKKNINLKLSPASLTKIMTNYILLDKLKSKKISLNDLVKINYNSSSKNPLFKESSLMFLKKNNKVSLKKLNKGMIIQSGNDASVAIAEYISGNENKFIKLMNNYAKNMKLNNTNFRTVHGLDHINQYTTSKDMAKLSILLIKNFPKEYKIYGNKKFKFNKIEQKNRNSLLWNKNFLIDGVKTGHTNKAGYNLIASSKKNNLRLISVILGSKSIKDRNNDTKKLIEWGYKNFKTKKIFKKYKKIIKHRIWFSKNKYINLSSNKNIYILYKKKHITKKKIIFKIFKIIKSPIKKKQIIGKIIINTKKKKNLLISLENHENKNIIKYYLELFLLFIKKIFHKIIFKNI